MFSVFYTEDIVRGRNNLGVNKNLKLFREGVEI